MKTSLFLRLTCFIVAVLASGLAASAAEKMNVLFIATDDWRPEIGCYGAKGMLTPNVDKLATSAVRFDRAYCQFPLCNPTRTSLLTGRFPTTSGVLDNTTSFRTAHPEWVTLPQHFKDNGYAVARTGKIFHGSLEDPKSWDEVLDSRPPAGRGLKPAPGAQPQERRKDGSRKQDPAQSDRIVVMDGDGEDHADFYTAMHGLEGHSFAALLRDPQAAWEHPAFTVSKSGSNGRAVRTERWRYAEFDGPDGGAMLFDEQADPHEMKNLAADPAHAKVVTEMKALLEKLPAVR